MAELFKISDIIYDHATLLGVAGFIVLMILLGRIRGFMVKLLSLCSTVGTLAIELKVYPLVLGFIENNEAVNSFFRDMAERLAAGMADRLLQDVAASYSGAAAGNADGLYQELTISGSPLYDLLGLDVLADNAAAAAVGVAGRVLCFAVIFIAVRIIVRLLMAVVRGLKKIRFIDWIDRLFGGLFGALEAVIYIWIAMFVISGFPGYAFTDLVLSQISESSVLSWLYSQNLVIMVFIDMLM